MLIPFGILSAAGVSGFTSDFELIESVFLTTTTASVTFSGLGDYSATYKHLQIRIASRGANASTNVNTLLRINADTGSNYAEHGFQGTGAVLNVTAQTNTTSMFTGTVPAASANANHFGATVIDLLDAYSTTKNKTIRYLNGSQSNSQIGIGSGHRRNTESTTSLTLLPAIGSWAANSRFSIYGIRG
jgi:hypothetical protein